LGQVIVSRIQAVASAQDLLSATGDEGSDLRTLVDAVVKPLSPDASRLEVIGPQVLLPVEATMPFAMILHELLTSSVTNPYAVGDALAYGTVPFLPQVNIRQSPCEPLFQGAVIGL
jgi:two-component sensor histidine kinase